METSEQQQLIYFFCSICEKKTFCGWAGNWRRSEYSVETWTKCMVTPKMIFSLVTLLLSRECLARTETICTRFQEKLTRSNEKNIYFSWAAIHFFWWSFGGLWADSFKYCCFASYLWFLFFSWIIQTKTLCLDEKFEKMVKFHTQKTSNSKDPVLNCSFEQLLRDII